MTGKFVTDLSPNSVAQGSNDPAAVADLAEMFEAAEVWHLPRLHAKVYAADRSRAIVTSGNLTHGGLEANFEYGIDIRSAKRVAKIRNDMLEFANLGTSFAVGHLRDYAQHARELRKDYQAAQASINRTASRRLGATLAGIQDELVRRQVAGGTVNQVFARTIEYLLRRYGPLETTSMHRMIQNIHRDLCDDSVDRVIDGIRYGKKWKHQVRSAQSFLKRNGTVELLGRQWRLIEARHIT